MAGSLEGVLARVPGLGGYVAGQQMGQRDESQQLAQLGALQQIVQRQQQAQEQQQAKALLMQIGQQAGGDPAKMLPMLMQAGPVGIKLAEGLKGLVPPQAKPQFINTVDAAGKPVQRAVVPTVGAEFPSAPKEATPVQPTKLEQLVALRDRWKTAGRDVTAVDNAIRKESETPRQISPTIKMPRQSQWVEIADPLKPGNTMKVNPDLYDETAYKAGNRAGVLGGGKPSAASQKTDTARRQQLTDINRAISELEKATTDGGLIDKSTGSGAGALADTAFGFFGKATPGAIAVGQMKPIFDLVLKMIPRFEGPQSDKDTKSYEQAAGQLANPNVPNKIKKEAGKEILRLMKSRRGQFTSKDAVDAGIDTGGDGGWKDI